MTFVIVVCHASTCNQRARARPFRTVLKTQRAVCRNLRARAASSARAASGAPSSRLNRREVVDGVFAAFTQLRAAGRDPREAHLSGRRRVARAHLVGCARGHQELRADRRRSGRARPARAEDDLGALGALQPARDRRARCPKRRRRRICRRARAKGSTTGSAPATAARARRSGGTATSTSSTRSTSCSPICASRPRRSWRRRCAATCSPRRSWSARTRRSASDALASDRAAL